MKIKDFQEQGKEVSGVDLDNFFEVYLDKRGNYAYNLNSKLGLDVSGSTLGTYVLTHDLHPTIVSYNIYGTPRLAWLISEINGIRDQTVQIPSGTKIRYVPEEFIAGLVRFMRQD